MHGATGRRAASVRARCARSRGVIATAAVATAVVVADVAAATGPRPRVAEIATSFAALCVTLAVTARPRPATARRLAGRFLLAPVAYIGSVAALALGVGPHVGTAALFAAASTWVLVTTRARDSVIIVVLATAAAAATALVAATTAAAWQNGVIVALCSTAIALVVAAARDRAVSVAPGTGARAAAAVRARALTRVFDSTLELRGAANLATTTVRERIERAIDDLDATMRELRTEVSAAAPHDDRDLVERVAHLARWAAPGVRLDLAGTAASLVSDDERETVALVLARALEACSGRTLVEMIRLRGDEVLELSLRCTGHRHHDRAALVAALGAEAEARGVAHSVTGDSELTVTWTLALGSALGPGSGRPSEHSPLDLGGDLRRGIGSEGLAPSQD